MINRTFATLVANLVVVLVAFFGLACPGPKGHSQAPVISSFTANPESITKGQSTTLSWSVLLADTVTIDQGIGSVSGTSLVVSPASDTTYTLTARGKGGVASATAKVAVAPVGVTWEWVKGSNATQQEGSYGTQGSPGKANVPGSREGASCWRDAQNQLWLFGGTIEISSSTSNYFNDVWKFDGTNWTWVMGSESTNQGGSYGTHGTAALGNIPGARREALTWSDGQGNVWLFGGLGYDSAGEMGELSDLWKFDGTAWTWVSGSDLKDQYGVFGNQGMAAAGNAPGARLGGVLWRDSAGIVWVFGGQGLATAQTGGYLNDLWKFDGTYWTWVAGSSAGDQTGNYGAQGVADPANLPGGRQFPASWIDSHGDLWLLGGFGADSEPSGRAFQLGFMNDLWKFDGTSWTWISGSDKNGQAGSYGVQGTKDPANVPGARAWPMSWVDTSDHLWLFGGEGNANGWGLLNDLWRFDGTTWTYMSGGSATNESGTYGVLGTPSTSNVAGARIGGGTWMDSSGDLWLFGGLGYPADPEADCDYLDDLWRIHVD